MISQISKYQLGLFIVAFSIASLVGINQYHFAMWNQFISLPWLYDLINPALYQNDLLVDQRVNSPTFFLYGLAALLPWFSQNIPLMFFSLYAVFLVLIIFSFYRLALAFFDDQRSGIFAVVLLSFAFPVIGDVSTWDSLLMERTAAFPFLLFSIYSSYSKKYWLTIVLQAAAFNIHPLSAVYIIAATWLGVLLSEGFKRDYFVYAAGLIILISPTLYLRFSGLDETAVGAKSYATWMKVMHLRNGNHTFPSEFPLAIVLKSLLIAFTYFLLVLKGGFKKVQQNYLLGFGFAILFMIALGIVFTEVFPVQLIIQLQFFRAYLFLVILTICLWAGLIITRPKPLFYLLALPVLVQYFYGEWAKTASVLIMASGAWFLLRFVGLRVRTNLVLSAAFLSLGLLALGLRGGLDIRQGIQEETWYEVQDWFSANTDINSLAIVPPLEAGFRVGSQRASYGDWFDGTKAFFSEEYAEYWLDHMTSLGCVRPDSLYQDYQKLRGTDFMKIWRQEKDDFSEAYVVHYANNKLENLDCVFRNEDFAVYRLEETKRN